MDRNFLLAMTLSLVVVVSWTMYTGEKQQRYLEENPSEAKTTQSSDEPGFPADQGFEPSSPAEADVVTPSKAPAAVPKPAEVAEERTTIKTALYEAELSTRGGALLRWDLEKYDDPSQDGAPKVELTTLVDDERALTTPLEGLGYGDLSTASYRMEESDALTRSFVLEHEGVSVRKTYTFSEDDYAVRLRIAVENGSDRHLRPEFAIRWPMRARDSADFADYSVAVRSETDVELLPITTTRSFLGMGGGGIEGRHNYTNVDWIAADTTYFLAAVATEVPERASASVVPISEGTVHTELSIEQMDLPPGQHFDTEYHIYLGPKETARLDAFGAHLDEAIQKGWFPSLTRFFGWLLDAAYSVIPNYGVSIILITIMVRLLMAPLMARQMKSMKRMSDIAPMMKEIQEKYKEDRERQSQEMMALYKREGVSPFSMLSGCFPMLLQFPVFIGFYFALQSAIALRQQPFVGWITDLSQPEALFVLPGVDIPVRVIPILMGGAMFLQQKLTPSGSMDPAQQRMMMTIMPVMFTVLFYQFASGLVLYWFVSTLIGIGQQVVTNRDKKPVAEK
ncbi:MAG: membrane protein insertase YidC [bacterium]|nr:membrane protein insertase YidC [bacterium]MCP5070787.1 membrane protein insertase YidC [bacterium]